MVRIRSVTRFKRHVVVNVVVLNFDSLANTHKKKERKKKSRAAAAVVGQIQWPWEESKAGQFCFPWRHRIFYRTSTRFQLFLVQRCSIPTKSRASYPQNHSGPGETLFLWHICSCSFSFPFNLQTDDFWFAPFCCGSSSGYVYHFVRHNTHIQQRQTDRQRGISPSTKNSRVKAQVLPSLSCLSLT